MSKATLVVATASQAPRPAGSKKEEEEHRVSVR